MNERDPVDVTRVPDVKNNTSTDKSVSELDLQSNPSQNKKTHERE